jgi:DNA-binding beta-propeller fold protein YncE
MRSFSASFAVVLLALTLGVTITAPGTVTTVVNPNLFTRPAGENHLHGIVRDPISGDIYVGDWNELSVGEAPFFAPYVENRDSIRRIDQLGEVSIVVYAISPNAMVMNEGDRQIYVVVGGLSCGGSQRATVPEFNGIVAIDPATGKYRYVSGGPPGYSNGLPKKAQFSGTAGIASDPRSGELFISEGCQNRIREVDARGEVTTVAESFSDPHGLAYSPRLNMLYVADTGDNEIRSIDADGRVSTLAGSTQAGFIDGTGADARFDRPTGVACDDLGNVYVADSQNNAIRKVTPAGVVTTVAGAKSPGTADGVGAAARFSTPGDLTYDPIENALYVVDWGSNNIRKVVVGLP